MRYYDIDINGRIIGSYSIPQPGKILLYLSEPTINYPMWSGTEWITDTVAQKEGNKNNIRQHIIDEVPYFAMLVIHLIQKLLQKSVIASNDFSQADRDEYQKILNWINEYLGL